MLYMFARIKNYTTIKHIAVIVILGIAAYWNIASCRFTLKNDILDADFPNKVLQSHIEHAGEIPLWDQFSYFGSAMHSKILMYYPVRFISSKLTSYSLYALNIEFMLHILLAGIGMYVLLKRFRIHPNIACIFGIAYMLSGFFSGNAQHMWWVVSGAFLPLVILTYYNLLHEPRLHHAALFTLVWICFVLGGYPAFTIIMLYAMIIYCAMYYIQLYKQKQFVKIRNTLLLQIGIGVVCIVMLLPLLVSYSEMVQHITRGEGVTLSQALWDSLLPQHFITFLFPLLTAYTTNNFWHIDPSMMNMYIGVLPLLLVFASVRLYKHTGILVLWVLALLFMSISMGTVLPVREFLYHYIPLFDTFRFPALFRLFFMFCLICLGAFTLQQIYKKITLKHMYLLLIGIAICSSVIALYFVIPYYNNHIELTPWHTMVESLYKKHSIGIHGLVLVVTSIVVLVYMRIMQLYSRLNSTHIVLSSMYMFVGIEMVISVLLISPVTIHNHRDLHAVQTFLDTLPTHTGVTNIAEPAYSQYSKQLALPSPLWRNNQLFHKKRTYDGYTSFVYREIETFEQSNIFDSVKKYPLMYIPQRVYKTQDTMYDYSGTIALIPASKETVQKFEQSNSAITLESSKSNEIICTIIVPQASYVVCMQYNYPGWKAYVNGVETNIVSANYCCMAVSVPRGVSQVQFIYAPRKAIIAYYVYQWALYILIGGCVLLMFVRKNKNA